MSAVTLMTATTALVALLCGIAAFDEPFGAGPLTSSLHLLAVATVLACVPLLAAGEAALVDGISAERDAGSPQLRA